MDRIRIGIVGYDDVAAINLVGPLEAFSNAFQLDEAGQPSPCYKVVVLSSKNCRASAAADAALKPSVGEAVSFPNFPNQFVTDTAVTFHAHVCSPDETPFDTIIVPGGRGMRCDETVSQVAAWVKAHARDTRRIASVCTGVYALASTGLLDGHRVTTHWQNAMDVAVRFPKLQVAESAIVLKDGKFYTAAGATAGIDLALYLIAEDFGRDTAVTVARKLLVYMRRDGGQEQYSEPANPDVHVGPETQQLDTNRMGKLVGWINKHLGEDLRLEILAKRALLSKNEFIQEFTGTFGVSPGLFVKNLRFNEARRRLMAGENAIKIARALGFADPAYFIQEFRRRYGVLPDDYQRHFGSGDGDSDWQPRRGRPEKQNGAPMKPNLARRPRITSFTRCIRQHVPAKAA